MDTLLLIISSLCILALAKSILFGIQSSKTKKKLPPGPTTFPIIGSFIWLRNSFFQLEPIVHNLMLKYGRMITLKIGSRPLIFIADHSLAHNALVQGGAVFSNRPKELSTGHINKSQQCNITTSSYGPNWRLLRRNMAETIQAVRVKRFSSGRKWVLGTLLQNLASESGSDGIKIVDHIQHAMFSLFVLMCFGEKFEGEKIREIERVHKNMFLSGFKSSVLNVWPKLGRIIFWKQREKIIGFRNDLNNLLIPIIKTRLEKVKERGVVEDGAVAYVDGLADLKLPEEGTRRLSDEEMVSLCGEFLNASTDTTSISLHWIMANLVKYPQVQEKLYQEIISAVGSAAAESADNVVKEEALQRMPYLKAVVLESLRLYPPAHLVVPHSLTEGVLLDGYQIPDNAVVIFMAAEMGRDAEVWKDPMEFRPERFVCGSGEEGFDITCSRVVKMMPFGAGRRMCPGYAVALLHLECFVANLVWNFEWKPAHHDNYDVDLSEMQGFTVGMKNPLLVSISPRGRA